MCLCTPQCVLVSENNLQASSPTESPQQPNVCLCVFLSLSFSFLWWWWGFKTRFLFVTALPVLELRVPSVVGLKAFATTALSNVCFSRLILSDISPFLA